MIKKILTIFMLIGCIGGRLNAYEPPLGEARNGIQASLYSDKKIYHSSKEIELQLTLTNISDESIEIDPWPGNWFVQVWDEEWNLMPNVRAVDVLREIAKTIILKPGEQWDTTIQGLSLTTGLEGSTPLWEYSSLKPGTYWIGAEYIVYGDSIHPNMWIGGVNCELIQIKIS